ncbi:ABC transporter substrate-binding protein [Clostridium beijerinckii]|uniref:ABC transporter substrate-binding protein n=1 Tax=Clostridium beijerinckii TaxID=1520 RepID=UPI00047BC546|nr:extracellular solute-binding protein [Clostridium beijerinckii]
MRKYSKLIKIVTLFLLVILMSIFGFNSLKRYIVGSPQNNENSRELEGSITFVSNRTDKSEELNSMIKEFGQIHPKVKINLELIGDAEEILERRAAAGELPDVTLVPGAIDTIEYSKYFLPIDDLGFNDENIYNHTLGPDNKSYTISTSMLWEGIIYNKEIFKAANIKEIPKTKKEFFEACKKIKEIGVMPIALNYKQPWVMSMWSDSIPYLLDTKLEENIVTKSKDILNNESGVYKSLEFIRGIVKDRYCEEDLFNYDWQQCKNDLKDKKVAMIIWNSDFKYQLEDMGASKEEFGIFPIPESKIISVVGDYKFAISKNTKYPDISEEFLRFMFNDDRYAKAVNIMSSLKSSERNIQMLKELEEFNLPIQLQTNVVKNQTNYELEIHNKYFNIKNDIGLNSSFVQRYVIASDTKPMIEEVNKKYRESRVEIR